MRIPKIINVKSFSLFTGLAVVFVVGLLVFVAKDTKDKISDVVDYQPPVALKILDRHDRLIANAFEGEFRYYAAFDEIPPRIIETLLAVEDTMFFEHSGVNFDAIIRAMLKNIQSAGYVEGGSTITQQLVKNLALTRKKTIDRKLKEAVLAIQVDSILSKEEILEKYINFIYFGHGYYGVKTAAHGYFNKDLKALTLKEIAMLMALPRAPSHYDPVKNYEFSLSRANNILERMFALGWITQEEYDTALEERPKVYDQTLTQNLAPYVVDEVLRQLSYIKDLKTGGYVVRLNIDLDYQKAAQEALIYGYNGIQERLDARRKNPELPIAEVGDEEVEGEAALEVPELPNDTLNGAMIVTKSDTGAILALVGGVDYAKSNFNRATQAQRQFGSAIKPFIYQIAFDMGYSSASNVSDVARGFSKGSPSEEQNSEGEEELWRPKNYARSFSGIVSLKDALRRSLNLATVNLVDVVGFQNIYDALGRYGFKNAPRDMSVMLGSYTLSVLDAARFYSLFSNYGAMREPELVRSIKNAQNEELYAKNPPTPPQTAPEQAYITIDILKSVVSAGTGRRASVAGIEVAGKTGTSNNYNDAWFSGFSPSLQVVVWYGRDDNTSIGGALTGGVAAAPAFARFFSEILVIEPGLKRKFDVPEGAKKQKIGSDEFYYTETSKIPRRDISDKIDDNLIF